MFSSRNSELTSDGERNLKKRGQKETMVPHVKWELLESPLWSEWLFKPRKIQ